jgi:large conductance mechanosensitive channel
MCRRSPVLATATALLFIKAINKLEKIGKASEAPKAPTEKECPYCKSMIPIKAVRCPHCTSELEK